jgi:hypothetical protein
MQSTPDRPPVQVRLLALCLVALLPCAVQAQDEAKRYDLRPRYTKGDKQEVEARLSLLLKLRLVLASEGIDRTSEQEQVVHRHYQDVLTKVESKKVAEVERKFLSAWEGIREPGAATLERSMSPMHQRTIVIGKDAKGRRKVWARHGTIDRKAIQSELPTERYEAILPKTPVAVGETWEIKGKDFLRVLGRALGDAPQGSITCTLKEVREDVIQEGEDPEQIAIVDVSIQASATRGTAADAPRLVTQMKGGLRFSLKRHKIVTVDLRGEARLRQTRREGESVLELEGRGPVSIKKRAWFPSKPKPRKR